MTEYETEIKHAILARGKGNEGMARVCARRATGIVIGEYLQRRGYEKLSTSTYDRLSIFNSLPDVNEGIKSICQHFILKVNGEHKLPSGIDLISEAQWLAKNLLLDNTN